MSNKNYIRLFDVINNQFIAIFNDTYIDKAWLEFAKAVGYKSAYNIKKDIGELDSSCLDNDGHDRNKYIHYVRLCYLLYGIQYEHFNVTAEVFYADNTPLNVRNVTHHFDHEEALYVSLYDLRLNNENFGEFENLYNSATDNIISNMKSSLQVYEYLEKHDYREGTYYDIYSCIHDDIYKKIEKKLENTSFKYTRILALPIHYKTIYAEKDGIITAQKIFENAFDLCTVPLFQHLARCLSKKDIVHPHFYIAPDPRWAFHWGVIDNGNYIITEYYRYDKEGYCKPQMLFVQGSLNPSSSRLAKIYLDDFEKLLKPYQGQRNLEISFENMTRAIEKIVKKSRSNVNDMNKLYNESEKDYTLGIDFLQKLKNKKDDAIKHLEVSEDKYNYIKSLT